MNVIKFSLDFPAGLSRWIFPLSPPLPELGAGSGALIPAHGRFSSKPQIGLDK